MTDGSTAFVPSSQNSILDGLVPPQLEAATINGPILVLAGAGTGKTKTLTSAVSYSINHYGIKASEILAVTFSNKAAREMSERISRNLGKDAVPSWIGTFHGLGNRQLRATPEIAGLRPNFDVLDADDARRVLKRTLKTLDLDLSRFSGGSNAAAGLKLMETQIGRYKDYCITPEAVDEANEQKIAHEQAAGGTVDIEWLQISSQVYKHYQAALTQSNSADFGDLLLWPTVAMEKNEGFRRRWADRFKRIFADEYQDVNYVQYLWLYLLACDHDNIFVVGDDDQALYSWRGSDVGYIRRFTEDFPTASVVKLEQNFRSTGHILDCGNAIISRDPDRLGKTLFTDKGPGKKVEVHNFYNSHEEASEIVAEMLRRRAEGARWDSMAILYRFNHMSRLFEDALRRAGIDYALIGDVSFYQRAEVKDAIALLKLVTYGDDPQSDEAFRRMINVPSKGFGDKAVDKVAAFAADNRISLLQALREMKLTPKQQAGADRFINAIDEVIAAEGLTLADQISLILDRSGYREMHEISKAEGAEARLENLHELVRTAGDYHSARELFDQVALGSSTSSNDETGKVKLMSIHRSKGLEFDTVFLPGWEAECLPWAKGDLAEERRIAYVAITRARKELTISCTRFRQGPATPSEFLEDLPEESFKIGWNRTSGQDYGQAENYPRRRPAMERRPQW